MSHAFVRIFFSDCFPFLLRWKWLVCFHIIARRERGESRHGRDEKLHLFCCVKINKQRRGNIIAHAKRKKNWGWRNLRWARTPNSATNDTDNVAQQWRMRKLSFERHEVRTNNVTNTTDVSDKLINRLHNKNTFIEIFIDWCIHFGSFNFWYFSTDSAKELITCNQHINANVTWIIIWFFMRYSAINSNCWTQFAFKWNSHHFVGSNFTRNFWKKSDTKCVPKGAYVVPHTRNALGRMLFDQCSTVKLHIQVSNSFAHTNNWFWLALHRLLCWVNAIDSPQIF